MRAFAKLGKPFPLLVAMIFAIGGVTAAAAGKPLEGILYFALAGGIGGLGLWGKFGPTAPPGVPAARHLRRRGSLRRELLRRSTAR